MSGGAMDYIYSNLEWNIPTAESIDSAVHLEEEGKPLAKKCIEKLKEAVIIAKRLEWWMSGDDGTESFKRRLKEELGYEL